MRNPPSRCARRLRFVGVLIAVVGAAPGVLAGQVFLYREAVDGVPQGIAREFDRADRLFAHVMLTDAAPVRINVKVVREELVVMATDQDLKPGTTQFDVTLAPTNGGPFEPGQHRVVFSASGEVLAETIFSIGTPPAAAAGDGYPEATEARIYYGPPLPEGVDPFTAPEARRWVRLVGADQDQADDVSEGAEPAAPAAQSTTAGPSGPVGANGKLDTPTFMVAITDDKSEHMPPPGKAAFAADTDTLYVYIERKQGAPREPVRLYWMNEARSQESAVIDMGEGDAFVLKFPRDEGDWGAGAWSLLVKVGATVVGSIPIVVAGEGAVESVLPPVRGDQGPVAQAQRIPFGDLSFGGQWPVNDPVFRATPEVGAWVECVFQGTGVRWLGYRFDDAGIAEVRIDGQVVAEVDQHAPGRNLPFDWEYKGLPAGTHRVRITALGRKNPQSAGIYINVAGLEAVGTAR